MSSPPPQDRILITGASSGIGAATARRACGGLARGAGRALARAPGGLAEELGGAEHALAVRCDVTEWEQQQGMVEAALASFGRIDAVFANAGFGGPRGFLNDTPEHWREMVLTNVYGAALTLRATIPALTDSRGHLLLTSSVAGRRALPGSLYSCTKHAVTAMGEAARQDLQRDGDPRDADRARHHRHPVLRQPPDRRASQDDDIARGVIYAISQPPHVDVNEILIRPTAQRLASAAGRRTPRRGGCSAVREVSPRRRPPGTRRPVALARQARACDDGREHVDRVHERARQLHPRPDHRVLERLQRGDAERQVARAERAREVAHDRQLGVASPSHRAVTCSGAASTATPSAARPAASSQRAPPRRYAAHLSPGRRAAR